MVLYRTISLVDNLAVSRYFIWTTDTRSTTIDFSTNKYRNLFPVGIAIKLRGISFYMCSKRAWEQSTEAIFDWITMKTDVTTRSSDRHDTDKRLAISTVKLVGMFLINPIFGRAKAFLTLILFDRNWGDLRDDGHRWMAIDIARRVGWQSLSTRLFDSSRFHLERRAYKNRCLID